MHNGRLRRFSRHASVVVLLGWSVALLVLASGHRAGATSAPPGDRRPRSAPRARTLPRPALDLAGLEPLDESSARYLPVVLLEKAGTFPPAATSATGTVPATPSPTSSATRSAATGTLPTAATPTASATKMGERTLVLDPVHDTYVADGLNQPMGDAPILRVASMGQQFLTLLRFDVPHRIHADGERVISASLELWCSDSLYSGSGAPSLELGRLLATWEESTATMANKPSVGGPKYRFAMEPCDQPGVPGRSPGRRSMDVTDMVQRWHQGELEDHGFEIGVASQGTQVGFTFPSKEGSPPSEGRAPRLLVCVGPDGAATATPSATP